MRDKVASSCTGVRAAQLNRCGMRHPAQFILSLLLALTLGACSESNEAYTKIRSSHAPLMANFESYISPAEARTRLPTNVVVAVADESKLVPGDPRPRFDWLELRVSGYRHLGLSGELVLRFFNERLVSTWFYPDSYDSYLKALRRAGVNITAERQRVGRYADAWTSTDYRDRAYVAWADRRLTKENNRWINRYS